MNKRPLSVTVIAWLFVALGAGDVAFQLIHFKLRHPFSNDVAWVVGVSLVAVVSGVWTLRGRDWARWLAIGWMAFHVVLSLFHSISETAVHGVLLGLIAYALFHPRASEYFRPAGSGAA